jgi:hypothetical protein
MQSTLGFNRLPSIADVFVRPGAGTCNAITV